MVVRKDKFETTKNESLLDNAFFVISMNNDGNCILTFTNGALVYQTIVLGLTSYDLNTFFCCNKFTCVLVT